MTDRNRMLAIFLSLGILFLITIGISYAYFTASITGEDATTITVTGGKMKVNFDGGNIINITNIIPSTNPIETKTFTVTGINTTELDMGYALYLVVEENSFDNYAIQYKLSGENTDSSGSTVPNSTDVVPIKSGGSTTLLGKGTFAAPTGNEGKVHTYNLEIFFSNMPFDQNTNHNKEFNAHIHIDDYSTGGNRLVNSLNLAEKAKKINMYQYISDMINKEYQNKARELDAEELEDLQDLADDYHAMAYDLRGEINSTQTFLNTTISRDKVESITFTNTNVVPEGVLGSFDVSELNNGSVMLWYENGITPGLYNIIIGQNGGVKAPIHSDFLFAILPNLSSVSGNLLTNDTRTMSYMFTSTGYNVISGYDLDLSGWNTTNVTDMSGMFSDAGNGATDWSINGLSGWEVSNVADMSKMFNGTAQTADSIELDLSWGPKTSKVTDMSGMFTSFGTMATTFAIIGLDNWDVSRVTNMAWMFAEIANNIETAFSLDLDNWTTDNVLDMSGMFLDTATHSTDWSVGTLADWNISNVNNLSSMFYNAGHNTATFELDLSEWVTSNITLMNDMFYEAGYNATTWSIGNIGGWQLSKVVHSRCTAFDNISIAAQTSLNSVLETWGCGN